MDPRESYGFFYNFRTPAPNGFWFCSGIWQERPLVGDPQPIGVDIAYIRDQFFDHTRYRIHTCNRISFSRLLLL